MRIITERKLRDFWNEANGTERIRREKAMREWITVIRNVNWQSFADIRRTFNHSDVYCKCTIFDIGGNKYRVIAKVAFRIKVVFIRYVLTHAEYEDLRWQADCD